MSSVDILSSKLCTPRHANARVRTHGCTDVRSLLSQLRAVYKQGLTDFLERLFELLQGWGLWTEPPGLLFHLPDLHLQLVPLVPDVSSSRNLVVALTAILAV